MSSMTYKDKKRKADHHVIGMADSVPQKSRRSVKRKPLGDDEVQQHNKQRKTYIKIHKDG